MELHVSQPRTDQARRRTLGARTALVVAAFTVAVALPLSGLAAGDEHAPVDAPDGFAAVRLAAPATFPDDVTAKLKVKYDQGGTIVANLPHDASNVLFAVVTWDPEGTSGWHTHPGPVIVTVAEGAVEVTNAHDCVARTYHAGEAFLDPGQGNIHVATNPSDDESAVAYAVFLGLDGPPTQWVEPADC